MKLFIKYMVSLRCKLIVKSQLIALGIKHSEIDLGSVVTVDDLTSTQLEAFRTGLAEVGLELLDDKRSIMIEKIKSVIVEMIHYADEIPAVNYSDYISSKLKYDYTYLSNMFSEVRGITIQQFIILHKIEKVKELLLYDELSLADIAKKLHYSSSGHMSNQFKKVTGLTPSFFRQMKRKRTNLEDL